MSSCDDAPWAQAPAGESLRYPELPEDEFEYLCASMWGFPEPKQLPPVIETYGRVEMPGLWNEATKYPLEDESGGFPMQVEDIALMHTPDVLPPEVFSEHDLDTLTIWDFTYWKRRKVPEGKVFDPVSFQLFNIATTKKKAFTQTCGMYASTTRLLKVMQEVFPVVAGNVELTLKAIMDPKFYMPVKCGKESKRKMTEADLQKEAKEALIKKVISSAYYRILFNRHDLEEYPADELAIMRALCPLREEDENNTHSL